MPQMHVHVLDLKANLRIFFPNKTDDDFARLDQAADALVVRGDGFINHAAMFAENALGTQNDFIEEIRDQHVRAVRNACVKLESKLSEIAKGTDVVGYEGGSALIYDVRNIVKECSGAPDKVVDRYVRAGLNAKSQDEVKWDSYVNVDSFMQNLFHHGYRNHQEYVSDCDVVLVAIKKGKGKIHQKMFDEKETKKKFLSRKNTATR